MTAAFVHSRAVQSLDGFNEVENEAAVLKSSSSRNSSRRRRSNSAASASPASVDAGSSTSPTPDSGTRTADQDPSSPPRSRQRTGDSPGSSGGDAASDSDPLSLFSGGTRFTLPLTLPQCLALTRLRLSQWNSVFAAARGDSDAEQQLSRRGLSDAAAAATALQEIMSGCQ